MKTGKPGNLIHPSSFILGELGDLMDREPHLLMCPPDYYGIEYEINPWMSRSRPCDHDLAAGQWEGLRRALEEAGARISCLRPVAGLPDLVFTANAALVCEDLAILSRFRH